MKLRPKYPFWIFNKVTEITREDNQLYMIRRTLLSVGKYFSVKLHKFIMSDDACLHSHPWPYLSIILSGGYYEWNFIKASDWKEFDDDAGYIKDGSDIVDVKVDPATNKTIVKRWKGPFSIMFRPSNWIHRIELEPGIQPTTLFFTGKVVHSWGFFTRFGFKNWREYEKREHC